MANNSNFMKSLSVDVPRISAKKDSEYFEYIYTQLLEYLKKIDFTSLRPNEKVTINNYKSSSEQDNFELKLTDEEIKRIELCIKILSNPKYRKFIDTKVIPSRSTQPDFSNLSEEEKKIAMDNYQKKLNDEDITIRLMTYIKELVNKYLIYNDPNIRKYHINLCTEILLSYSRSHPLEVTKIHFRFKSPKGLITKIAKNIILDGTYERDPKTGIDILRYKEISDAFGAKIVSEKGYDPKSSTDPKIKDLIEERNKNLHVLEELEIFKERIDNLLNGEDEKITYREYLDTCVYALSKLIELINPNENLLIDSVKDKIKIIYAKKHSLDKTADLDEPILDFEIFDDPNFKFRRFYTLYSQRLHSPLALAGLKKGLRKIFNNPGTTNQEILEKRILDSFKIKLYKIENKNTSSGHEGTHVDIITPFGKFEFQIQEESQYVSDQVGEITAHMLMDNKDVPLFPIPKAYPYSEYSNNPSNYIVVEDSEDSYLYYKKKEVNDFINNVELITAKKGKISYNRALNNAQIELYSSFYNYQSLAMEMPDNNPQKKATLNYFIKLSEKSYNVRNVIFHYVNPVVNHLQISQIKDYILSIQHSLPSGKKMSEEEPPIEL